MSTWEEEKISGGKRASYSMIWFLDYIVIAGSMILLFHYYEVELGLSTALVGLALVIFALWNMINDPLIGFLTDKPMRWSKKYGLRMPWILIGGILAILFYVLLFMVPQVDARTNPWPLFWYIVIITCLYDTFYSILTTHAYGGFTNIFRTRDDRRKGGTIGQFMGTISRLVMMGIIIPYIIVPGDPTSYVKAAIVTGIIIAIALVLFIPGIHEDEAVKKRYLQVYEYLEKRKLPYFKFLKIAFKQKNFKLEVFAFAMFTFGYALYFANSIYFIEEVLQESLLVMALANIAYTVGYLITIWIWSRYVADRIGHSKTYALGLGLLGICFFAAMWYTTVIEYVVWHLIAGIGMTAFAAVWMSIQADVNDEVTNACEVHQEATLMGIRNFFFRLAWMMIGLVMALTHLLTGYIPGAAEQTELAKLGIRILVGGIPGISCIVGGFVFYKFYNLKGEKREKLMKSLREKGL
ncbi:MAG: MFS transporter [Promethearchaeota archaeon]